MPEPTATVHRMLLETVNLFWSVAGEVAYLWLELTCAVVAVAMFCWVVSR